MITRCECGGRAKMFSALVVKNGRRALSDTDRIFRCLECSKTWPAPPRRKRKTASEWRAEISDLEKALLNGADYLEDLHANLMRNNADMRLDPCEAPDVVAQRLRAAVGWEVTPCGS